MGKGFWSDGCYLVHTGSQPKIKTKKPVEKLPYSVKTVIENLDSNLEHAHIAGVLSDGLCEEDVPLVHVISKYSGLQGFFQVRYVDHVMTLFPEAEAFIKKDTLVFKDRNRVVGAVMAMRIFDDGLPEYLQSRYEKLNGLEVKKAA